MHARLKLVQCNWCLFRDIDEQNEQSKIAAQLILNDYFGGKYNGAEDMLKFAEPLGDSMFNYVTTKSARLFAQKNSKPVYEYRNNFVASEEISNLLDGITIPGHLAKTMAKVRRYISLQMSTSDNH
jgi:hypothetical protein